MKKIDVKLFGAFRKYVPSGNIEIVVNNHINVFQIKEEILKVLQQQVADFNESSLVYESALATESEVLNEDSPVTQISNLALLPPVCGG